MYKLKVYFVNFDKVIDRFDVRQNDKGIKVRINIYKLSNYKLKKEIRKIIGIKKMFDNLIEYGIIFDHSVNPTDMYKILSRLHNIFYSYYPEMKPIKIYHPTYLNLGFFMNEITLYKNIIMKPDNTTISFLNYIKSRVPNDYLINVTELGSDPTFFPLTLAVGAGSVHKSFFAYIKPKVELPGKHIYLIGKSVIYDSGGLNLKRNSMHEMKIDMTGASLLISLLNLLSNDRYNKYNIHILLPIVENMISNNATKPGSVVKTMSNKTVEIIDTDGEGRLCIVDGIDYINLNLIQNKNPNDCLIIDVATLTGNTQNISAGSSCLCTSNNIGKKYLDELVNVSDETGEYIDYLKIHDEYIDALHSSVADIKNINGDYKAGCVIAATFIKYFVKETTPWIHIDLGVSTFINDKVISFGLNLLYQYIKKI